MSVEKRILEFNGFRLDINDRSLTAADGTPVPLTPRLFDTLVFMIERQGRLIEKRALMESVWARVIVEENTLSRTISTLRQLLGETAGDNRFIATVPGVGYRFVPAVTLAGARPSPGSPGLHSIAVLPFDDLSPEHDQKYFADGIAEELIMQLSAIRALRVMARASSFLLAGASVSDAGRKLNVSHVMTGAVRKSGSRLRINVHLIDTATDQQIWSGQYDRLLDDILAVQDDISRAVAQALRATLGLGSQTFRSSSAPSAEAYDLYLRGKSLVSQGSAPRMLEAIELWHRAVAIDPTFALAWSNIAMQTRGMIYFSDARAEDIRGKIRDAATRAVEAEPHWWPTHLAQSAVHHLERDWGAMERSLSIAAEYAPGFPWDLNFQWGGFHMEVGDATAAVEYMREAVEQNPLALMTSAVYQVFLHKAGQEDAAEVEYRRSLDLPGDRDMVEHVALHRAWARGGDFSPQYARYVVHQSFAMPVLVELLGRHQDAEHVVSALLQASAAPLYRDPARQLMLAWWLARYRAHDAAFAILKRVYVDMAHPNVSWLWFPAFAPIRKLPGFIDILTSTGLAGYWQSRQNWGEFCTRSECAAETA